MSRYNATYYFNANEYPAAVSLERDKLCIEFKDGERTAVVHWYYEQTQKSKDSATTFEYPGYPLQTLVVLDPSLTAPIQAYCEQSRQRVVPNKMRGVLKMFAAVVAFLMLAYLYIVPWLAGSLAESFPARYENSLGQQMFASLKNSLEVDEKRTAYINTFYDELKVPSDYDIRITVVKNETANAFALPGGNIIVHDKLLQAISSYEELAALLAHEFVHVENRHSLRSLFRRMSGYIFLSLLLGDAGAVTSVIANNADNLKNLSYSRRLEKEADEEGAQLLVQRNINCNGFVRLFGELKKQSAGVQPAEWLSSHPDLEKRIQNIIKNHGCREGKSKTDPVLHTLFLKIKTAE